MHIKEYIVGRGINDLDLPYGAKIMEAVQINGRHYIAVFVTGKEDTMIKRQILMCTAEYVFPESEVSYVYINSCVNRSQTDIFHFFELIPIPEPLD